ncbi:hypothetical protein M408DRAFT_139999 [Serendipita vermifera MAFF 305830]|uniref:CN hydrolase domain-containing protein n=1 Tax=Serendipita vermifera MAFF 305830 TaxID=933852 RepID=A0A0C2WQ48_SERVB|nr:hypothetical protein M408DRAFT_139999 [Serendipita vermifera MAFF 305830]
MASISRRLRVGVVQYDPKITEVEVNMKRVRSFLEKTPKGSLDLLCLPETALTGYVFPTPEDVKPVLEEPKTGPTSLFAQELSRQLACYVVAGFPERLAKDEEHPAQLVGANSAIMYDPTGTYVGQYRKTNLFEADLPWVKPGTGFISFPQLPDPISTLSLGICMDLNPGPTTIELPAPCELASFALSNRSRVLVLLCAWLDSGQHPDTKWDLTTIQYWLGRLLPLWSTESEDLSPMNEYPVPDDHDETIVIICNRTGNERGSIFAGCSMAVKCSRARGEWDIVGLVDKNFEGLATWSIE